MSPPSAGQVAVGDDAVPVALEFDARGRLANVWTRRGQLAPHDPGQLALAEMVDTLGTKLRRARKAGADLAELRRRAELALAVLAQLEAAEEARTPEPRAA